MPVSLTGNLTKDPGINKFQKTNLYYSDNPYLIFQDPTWLGFKLLFLFDQPDSKLLYAGPTNKSTSKELVPNTAYSYLKNIGDDNRANYIQKFVNHLREINQQTPWFFQTIDGLADAWKRGYNENEFKSMLPMDRKITIGCLESIDLRMSALMDFYRKACFDWKYRREIVPWNLRTFSVYIYVYELRNINRSGMPSASGILDLTRLAGIPDINITQQKNNATLLGQDILGDISGNNPAQAIKDKVTNIVAGIQSNTLKGIKSAITPSATGNESANTINPYINRFLFKFEHCEWLPDESADMFDKVSSSLESDGMATQKIVFSYRDVEEVNLYNIYSDDQFVQDAVIRLLDSSALDNKSLSGGNSSSRAANLYGNLKNQATTPNESYGLAEVLNPKYNALLPFASLAGDKIERIINSNAGKLLLGNIFGFAGTTLAGAAQGIITGDANAAVRGTETVFNTISGSNSLRNKTNDVENLGNIFK